MGLIEELGDGPVALDTAAFIYYIEESPPFLAAIKPVFAAADAGSLNLVTSALTLLELLVVPFRAGDKVLAARYERILTNSRGVTVVDLSRDLLRQAAWLRATTGIKTPDAIQVAAALATGCAAFLTNDRRLPAVPGLRIIQLSAYA
jgi:predicted nucleic acid-binding protein